MVPSASSLRGSPVAPLRSIPRAGIHRKQIILSPLNSRASSRKRRQRANAVFDLGNLADDDDADADPPPSPSPPPPSSSTPRLLPRSLSFRVAAPGADLRAAASLRALAFSTNLQSGASASAEAPSSSSSGPSLFAREAWIRTRSREAWDALEARARGADEDYAGCGCLCLIGTIEDCCAGSDDGEDAELARAVRAEGDASCTLAAVAADLLDLGKTRGEKLPVRARRRLAVASLDIIVGPRLPSEALVAGAAAGGGAPTTPAYLANVSVAPAARRRGLGVALLSEAISLVASGAVPSPLSSAPLPARVAVHAEARNAAARALYEHHSLGFELEQEESLKAESLRGRPRRVLYSRPVVL